MIGDSVYFFVFLVEAVFWRVVVAMFLLKRGFLVLGMGVGGWALEVGLMEYLLFVEEGLRQ